MHTQQPFEDSHKIYNHHLEVVQNFLRAPKLSAYYLNIQSALLLTHVQKDKSSLPGLDDRALLSPRMDEQALNLSQLFTALSPKLSRDIHHSQILENFLDFLMPSGDLDAERYATVAFVCLIHLFGDYWAPVSRSTWFSRHSQARIKDTEHLSRWHGPQLRGTLWWGENVAFYWHLRTCIPDHSWSNFGTKTFSTQDVLTIYWDKLARQQYCSIFIQFLLEGSSYSDQLLSFSRRRVFRFGYLHRKHPI